MKKSILIFLIALVLWSSCAKTRETASGQKFNVIRAGSGQAIDSGKFLILNFKFQDGKDSVWNDSQKNGYPLIMQKNGIKRPGDRVLEVINMLSKGDSVMFKIPAKEVFTKSFNQPLPLKIDSTSSFTFMVGVKEVFNQEEFSKYRADLMAKQNEKAQSQQKEQLGKDTVAIDDYLKGKNIAFNKTALGIRYFITKSGTGKTAATGQTVKVNYAGYLLNGKYFDTNIQAVAKDKGLLQPGRPYSPYEVIVDRSQVIQGWHDALKLMNKGSKMTVYIPSTLAYGNQKRSADIIENSILIFDLEMVNITDTK